MSRVPLMSLTLNTQFSEGTRSLGVASGTNNDNRTAMIWLKERGAFKPTFSDINDGFYNPWWIIVGFEETVYYGFALLGARGEPYEETPRRLHLVEIRVEEAFRGRGLASWIFRHALQMFDIEARQLDYREPIPPLTRLLDSFGVPYNWIPHPIRNEMTIQTHVEALPRVWERWNLRAPNSEDE